MFMCHFKLYISKPKEGKKMKKVTLATIVALTMSTGIAQADDDDYVIHGSMSVRTDTQLSGSGHTILENCGPSSGNQSATVKVSQDGGNSKAKFKIRDASPDTVYTVWIRIKGKNGLNPAGSPLTGGGATPLAPGTALDGLNAYSPWSDGGVGTPNPTNGFTTDANGDASWIVHLDFPIVGGAYPFQKTATSRPGHEGHANVPTAIANPADAGQADTAFLFRVVSHCTDNAGHGLSPAVREAWFQYP